MGTAPDGAGASHEVIRQFGTTAILSGAVSLLLAAWLTAVQLWPTLAPPIAWLSHGRLAIVQQHLLLFGLGGSALIASLYSLVNHDTQARPSQRRLQRFTLQAWQTILVLGSISIAAGFASGHGQSEYPWPLNLLMLAVWIAVAWLFHVNWKAGPTARLPVAGWCFIGCLVMILMQHTLLSLAVPLGPLTSLPMFSGSLDALLQSWQKGMLPGGMLALGFIAMAYQALSGLTRQPLHSHRLAIISFWLLVLLLPWSGAVLLHASALPQWSQALGMAMGLLLLAPGLAIPLNGLLTLKADWPSLRHHPQTCLLGAALLFLAISVMEHVALSIAPLNDMTFSAAGSLSPAGTLGVIGLVCVLMLYRLRLPEAPSALIMTHAWLAIAGTLLCIAASWTTTLLQGSLWHAVDAEGQPLHSLADVLAVARPPMLMTLAGLSCWALGLLLMAAYLLRASRRPITRPSTQQARHHIGHSHARGRTPA